MFESLDEKVRGKHCDGIAGIIEEGKSIMEEDFDETTMDACLIAAGQRAEHYEMAAYGTLVAWAQAMGHTEAAKLLQQTLEEEKAADKKLSGLAEGGINQSAADAAHPDDDEEPVGAAASGAQKELGEDRSPVAVGCGQRQATGRAWPDRSAETTEEESTSSVMGQSAVHGRKTHARAGHSPVVVPVAGTALLLIDVINDLAFDGSEPSSRKRNRWPRRSRVSSGAPRPPACRRSISTITSASGGLIFAARSRIAPRAPLRAIACRDVSGRRRVTTSC